MVHKGFPRKTMHTQVYTDASPYRVSVTLWLSLLNLFWLHNLALLKRSLCWVTHLEWAWGELTCFLSQNSSAPPSYVELISLSPVSLYGSGTSLVLPPWLPQPSCLQTAPVSSSLRLVLTKCYCLWLSIASSLVSWAQIQCGEPYWWLLIPICRLVPGYQVDFISWMPSQLSGAMCPWRWGWEHWCVLLSQSLKYQWICFSAL